MPPTPANLFFTPAAVRPCASLSLTAPPVRRHPRARESPTAAPFPGCPPQHPDTSAGFIPGGQGCSCQLVEAISTGLYKHVG